MSVHPIALVTPVALAAIYLLLFAPAAAGWGLATPTEQASFWYFGGANVYTSSPSVREGSVGGPGQRSGSFGGK